MPNRSYFVPDSWTLPPHLLLWAVDTFKVQSDEVLRQISLMRDHEFRRPYSCWDRVFRNWMRKADQIGTLQRERKLRQPQEITEEERQQDLLKFKEQMEKYGVEIK